MSNESLSRRTLLFSLPAVFAATRSMALAQAPPPSRLQKLHLRRKKPVVQASSFVYFGTDTSRGISKGIYQSRFDAVTGLLTPPTLATSILRPAYLAAGSVRGTSRRILYSVAEGSDMETSSVLSYVIDPRSGALSPLNRVSAGGLGPAYISVDDTLQSAFVANYAGGIVSSYKILPDGSLSEPVERLDFHDVARFGALGPNTARQQAPHPHSATLSPDNRFLLVNDLGKDAIDVFPIDPATAHMGVMEPHRFTNNHAGSGPRHVAFHPNGRWVYSINELDSTIDHYLWQTTHKAGESQAYLVDTLTPVKLLDDKFSGHSTAAELMFSPDGYFLYASNRGEDSLVVFSVDQATGKLTFVQRIPCGGKVPRHFTLSPSGNWLLCGNQDSATITVFHRESATGKLTGPTQTVLLDSPMFTLFV